MIKSSHQATFLPAQTSLLSSIQRAKERIFSKSQRENDKNNTSSHNATSKSSFPYNDQNSSLRSNMQPQATAMQKVLPNFKLPVKVLEKQIIHEQFNKNLNNSQQVKRQKSNSLHQQVSNTQNQSTAVVANAIKLLQQKIHELQNKNKLLEQRLNQSRIIEFSQQKARQIVQKVPSMISQESDLKSYLLLKQQCDTLQKEKASLYQELLKRSQNKSILDHKKESGRKLNFHHEISQNISGVYEASQQSDKEKIRQLQEKLVKKDQEIDHYRSSLEGERKKNFAILKLHQEEIIKSEQLQIQVSQLKAKVKELQQVSPSRAHKSITSRRQSTQIIPSNQQIRQSVIRKKNLELQKLISQLREQLENEKASNQQKTKEVTELQRRYFQVKESFIELYKDLLKYHPEVINSNIKFLYDRIRKGEEIMIRSRSILSHKFARHSQSRTNNRLSEFRSKSGKKGLKMEDLNSSKRSQSRDRTNSKNSNRSNSKSNYRSPYAQQQIKKKTSLKSALSPSDKQRYKSTTGLNSYSTGKMKEIQKIIIQIKQTKRQINAIKSEHRNLSVKMGPMQIDGKQPGAKMSIQDQKNQEKMNKLIEEFNQKNAKLSQLKLQKDRLAMETVPGVIL